MFLNFLIVVRFSFLFFIFFLCNSCANKSDDSSIYNYLSSSSNIGHSDSLVQEVHYIRDNSYAVETLDGLNMQPLSNNKFPEANGEFWFRVRLKKMRHPQRLIFNVKENSISEFKIYGDGCLLGGKENSVGLSSIAVPVKIKKINTFYIKVNFPKQVNFPFRIQRIEKFHIEQQIEYLEGSWYYGFLLMVLILNTFFYFSTYDITYLIYCLLAITANIVISYYDGYAYYFFPKWFHYYGEVFAHILIVPFSGLMALKFLNVITTKRLKILFFLSLIEFLFFLAFVVSDNFMFFKIGDVLTFLFVGYYFSYPIRFFYDSTYAKLFLFGYLLLFISGILFMLPLDFGIHLFDVSINFMKAGSLVENLILTYAISFRVKQMKLENIDYETSIKKYVEELFTLRTSFKNSSNSSNGLIIGEAIEGEINNLANRYELTNREIEVLSHVVNGDSYKQISEVLFITVNTVKFHTRNIYQKLNINKREDILKLLQE